MTFFFSDSRSPGAAAFIWSFSSIKNLFTDPLPKNTASGGYDGKDESPNKGLGDEPTMDMQMALLKVPWKGRPRAL